MSPPCPDACARPAPTSSSRRPIPTIARERCYEHDGIDVYRYPIPGRPDARGSPGARPARGAERFHDWLRRRRPDVVHVHAFVTGLGLRELKAARAAGARVIVTTHSGSLGFICQRGTMMRWGRAALRRRRDAGEVRGVRACSSRGLGRPLARVLGAIPPAARPGRALAARQARHRAVDERSHHAAMRRCSERCWPPWIGSSCSPTGRSGRHAPTALPATSSR